MQIPANNRVLRAAEVELKGEGNVVSINRVSKVVKGGRRFSFAVILVVGDGKGIVGYGLGKANEVNDAREDAKKNLVRVPLYKNTVPHQIEGKFSGGYVFLKPASPGTGIIAGGAMRAVLDAAGIHDVLAKSKGSSNPHNVVKATIDALVHMRDARAVAINRGIPMSKVFNG
jgi:small subunit ribosomal protein S5